MGVILTYYASGLHFTVQSAIFATRELLLKEVSQSVALWDKIKYPCYLDFKINSRSKILLLIGILNFEISAIFEVYKSICHQWDKTEV